jgi:hypothetical protein
MVTFNSIYVIVSDIHFLLQVAFIKLQCTFVFCKTHDGRWLGRFLKSPLLEVVKWKGTVGGVKTKHLGI